MNKSKIRKLNIRLKCPLNPAFKLKLESGVAYRIFQDEKNSILKPVTPKY